VLPSCARSQRRSAAAEGRRGGVSRNTALVRNRSGAGGASAQPQPAGCCA
jgi:hypothetical protein